MGVTLKGVKITLEVESLEFTNDVSIENVAEIMNELYKLQDIINAKLS